VGQAGGETVSGSRRLASVLALQGIYFGSGCGTEGDTSQVFTACHSCVLFSGHPAQDLGPELLIPELSELQLKAPGVVLGYAKITPGTLTARSQASQMASWQVQGRFRFSVSLCLHLVSEGERSVLVCFFLVLLVLH